MVALKTLTIVTKNILTILSGGGHLPELVGVVVHAPHLPGLGLHPSLGPWLAFSPLLWHGGHSGYLPELVGGLVLAPLHGLVLHPGVPGGGHLPKLVGGVVLAHRLLGLVLHPFLALWLAFPSLPGHGAHSGHLPEL